MNYSTKTAAKANNKPLRLSDCLKLTLYCIVIMQFTLVFNSTF